MFKHKLPQQEQGFTLIEVLVAILVATIFVTVTMQMMVIATVFKVKAQENAEATNWIQEDLENVRYQAGNLQFPLRTSLTANATAGANSITVGSTTNLAVDDTLKIGLDSSKYKITAISGTTLNITPKLATNQVTNAAIAETTMCSAGQTDGLADALRDQTMTASNLVSSQPNTDPTKTFRTGKQFIMRKTAIISGNAPYNLLQLKYEVSPGTTFVDSKKIAQFNTEVIPNVAFQCP
jgi:prepilin-type N-terminal cleavage/methylation domain-containing protein